MSLHRVYCHAFVSAKAICRNVIVEWNDDNPAAATVEPFSREMHSTTAFNGIIVLAPEGYTPTVNVNPGNIAPALLQIQTDIIGSRLTRLLEVEFQPFSVGTARFR